MSNSCNWADPLHKKKKKLSHERLLWWFLSGFVDFLPTYNHQIQQRFPTLPLLQLSLDIERLPGFSRGASWGWYCRGLVCVGPFGWSLGTFGCCLRWRGRGGVFGAATPAYWSSHNAVLPCAEEEICGLIMMKHNSSLQHTVILPVYCFQRALLYYFAERSVISTVDGRRNLITAWMLLHCFMRTKCICVYNLPGNIKAHGLLLARDSHAGHFGYHFRVHFIVRRISVFSFKRTEEQNCTVAHKQSQSWVTVGNAFFPI